MMFEGVLEIVVHGPASAGLNPLPVMVTPVPAVPDVGTTAMVGPVTVKVADALSPSGLPVTVIV